MEPTLLLETSFTSYVYIPNEDATVDDAAFDATATWAKEGTDKCFEITSNVLSDYYCGREVTVPDGVITIADNTFKDKGLTSVTFSLIVSKQLEPTLLLEIPFLPISIFPMKVLLWIPFDSSVIVAVEGTCGCHGF